MSAADVIVIGAGALGSAVAAELSLRGRRVLVVAPDETSASAKAAGMIAPAFESVLDAPMAQHADLLRAGRDLWPEFSAATGVRLHREGAEWRGPDTTTIAAQLTGLGFGAEMRDGAVYTADDWRIEPGQALAALAEGVERRDDRLVGLTSDAGRWEVATEAGERLQATAIVLATGWAAPDCGLALPPIRPIKGQAVRLEGPAPDRVVRGEGVYVAPAPGGAIVGATMGEGQGDLGVDPGVTDALLARARAICLELAEATVGQAYAGVRGASPDGLPYAGRIAPGAFVALAPRRNGWLLAPLVARVVADALEGGGPDATVEAMDPGRFS
jgi:glycine oxidase